MKTEWDLSALLKSDDDPRFEQDQAAIRKRTDAFVNKWQDRHDYLSDPGVLKEALDGLEAFERAGGTDGDGAPYYWLRSNQDSLNTQVKAKLQMATNLSIEMANRLEFFTLRLAKAAPEQRQRFLADPQLADYRHFLERLFAHADHQLTEEGEQIMNLKSTPAHQKWVDLTEQAVYGQEREVLNAKGRPERLSFESMMGLLSHKEKPVRDKAAEGINDVLAQARMIAEAEVNALLNDKQINDQLRGYERPDSSRHLSDDMETPVVDAMLQAVEAGFELARRFYRLKADLLGLPKLAYHERNLEYGELSQEYPLEDGVRIVREVYRELEPRFEEIFNRYLKNGQLDIFPAKGKRGGAFCAHFAKTQPSYLLFNYTNRLTDVTTLGHELGHGLNNEYMKEAQNALNFGVPMATAEVASQYLEDFVLERILQGADDEMRLAVQMNQLNDVVSAIFRQVACYRFEQELHRAYREQGYLSADEIGAIFQKHMEAYMGPAVEQSPGAQNWWIHWTHIRSYFYVYAYAGGLLIAKAMQRRTREDKGFMDEVKRFLSAGRSASPREVFARMGIDIADPAFWQSGLQEVQQLYDDTEALAKKLGKL